MNISEYSHIIPALQDLHWLPVHARIHFKILILVFKVLGNYPKIQNEKSENSTVTHIFFITDLSKNYYVCQMIVVKSDTVNCYLRGSLLNLGLDLFLLRFIFSCEQCTVPYY